MSPERQRSERKALFGNNEPPSPPLFIKATALGLCDRAVPVVVAVALSLSSVEIGTLFPAGLLGTGQGP